ncbi:MAG: serine hydrolase domain-containing protein [Hyphomonadaceae bacterium]
MIHLFKLVCLSALLLTSCTPAPETQTPPEPQIVSKGRIDQTLFSLVDQGMIAGGSALVFEDGQEVYFGAFGLADGAANRDFDRDTLVQIYSMTKPITGVALMTLYEQGLFSLDDPISKHVPELASLQVFSGKDENGDAIVQTPEREPTVRDFMRHSAGLADNDDNPVGEIYRLVDPTNWNNTLTQVAEKLGQIPLLYEPGTQWRYSAAVDIQALMVERLSGMPFDDYVQQVIFTPLEMSQTYYFVPESQRSRMAGLYQTQDDGSLIQLPNEEAHAFNIQRQTLTPGTFGFVSSIDDYMRFALMLQNEGTFKGVQILEPQTVALMATNMLSDDVTERFWLPGKGQVGFGLDFAVRVAPPVNADENFGVVGEFFWDGFASTLFWVDPENDLTAVLFVQITPFNNDVHNAFRDAVYNQPD